MHRSRSGEGLCRVLFSGGESDIFVQLCCKPPRSPSSSPTTPPRNQRGLSHPLKENRDGLFGRFLSILTRVPSELFTNGTAPQARGTARLRAHRAVLRQEPALPTCGGTAFWHRSFRTQPLWHVRKPETVNWRRTQCSKPPTGTTQARTQQERQHRRHEEEGCGTPLGTTLSQRCTASHTQPSHAG